MFQKRCELLIAFVMWVFTSRANHNLRTWKFSETIRDVFRACVIRRTNGYVNILAVSLVKQWSIDRSQSNSRVINCIIERCGTNINGTSSSPCVVSPNDRGEARRERAKLDEAISVKAMFPSKEASFPAKAIFSCRRVIAYTTFSYRIRVRRQNATVCPFQCRNATESQSFDRLSRLLFMLCTATSQKIMWTQMCVHRRGLYCTFFCR